MTTRVGTPVRLWPVLQPPALEQQPAQALALGVELSEVGTLPVKGRVEPVDVFRL